MVRVGTAQKFSRNKYQESIPGPGYTVKHPSERRSAQHAIGTGKRSNPTRQGQKDIPGPAAYSQTINDLFSGPKVRYLS